MPFWPFLDFFSFLVNSYLAFFVLMKDPRSRVNRACAGFLFSFAIWGLGRMFVHNPDLPKYVSFLADCFSSPGWTSFPVFWLYFALVFTGRDKKLRAKTLLYSLFFILPAVFVYKQCTGFLVTDYKRLPWGWYGIWSSSIWPSLYYLYYGSLMLLGLYLIIIFGRRSKKLIFKRQAKIIFVSALSALIGASLTDVVFPEINFHLVPDIGDILSLFWAGGLAYCISKYRFFRVTPADIARTIITVMSDPLCLLDQKGDIVTVNDAGLNLLGYEAEEIYGKSVSELLAENDGKKAVLGRIINEDNSRNYEVFLRTRTGGQVPVIFSSFCLRNRFGEVEKIVCLARDITERKRAEEELQRAYQQVERKVGERTAALTAVNREIQREIFEHKKTVEKPRDSEQRLSVTLRSIGDGVITTDREGEVVLLNKAAEEATGWAQDEAVKKKFNVVFHTINRKTGEPGKNVAEEVLKTGQVTGLESDTVLLARDGTERFVAASSAPIRDSKSHEIVGGVVVFRDITERKRLEEDLLKTQKLESLGILAGGIAHDFNNILTVILGNICLAKMHTVPEERVFRDLTGIEKACAQAKDLTQRLLTFSKGGLPVKETTSIADLFRESATFALRGLPVGCEFDLPPNLWPVEIDTGQINQVINNLVINAAQAMAQGGVVTIRGENVTIGQRDSLPLAEGRYVKVSIEDQGCGISEKHLSRIFDPFFTTKEDGSGLGLATTYSIIKKHNGHIYADSWPGKGTTFYIYLPVSSRESPKKETIEKKFLTGHGKILIMDDEESVREVLGTMLNSIGYETEFTCDGSEALEVYRRAQESKKSFDAVFLDLVIPGGMGGKEAVKKLREIDPTIKVIVSSGYSTNPVMANFKKYGFSGILLKPYNLEKLSETLHNVLNGVN